MPTTNSIGILCGGSGAWAFEPLAVALSEAIGVPVLKQPGRLNYVLTCDDVESVAPEASFIPPDAVRIASDKRLVAKVFADQGVPTPETHLCEDLDGAKRVASSRGGMWCVKYPIGTGAAGHRMFEPSTVLPQRWPKPLVLQEFVELERPRVYRIYCAGRELFGWVVRQHPDEHSRDPWVAHARGAQYEIEANAPPEAQETARAALAATNLLQSFGCVDLLPAGRRGWLALEVGTDGVYNYVDRALSAQEFEHELTRRIAMSFRKWAGSRTSRGVA